MYAHSSHRLGFVGRAGMKQIEFPFVFVQALDVPQDLVLLVLEQN